MNRRGFLAGLAAVAMSQWNPLALRRTIEAVAEPEITENVVYYTGWSPVNFGGDAVLDTINMDEWEMTVHRSPKLIAGMPPDPVMESIDVKKVWVDGEQRTGIQYREHVLLPPKKS